LEGPQPDRVPDKFRWEYRAIIGVGAGATKLEVEGAYRRLALLFHLDRCRAENKEYCRLVLERVMAAKDALLT